MLCKGCKKESRDYLENGYCYSCRRRHFEETRPLMLFDFIDAETKKKMLK